MNNKILITGSTGFVGKNLVPKLINEGYEILEITRDISKSIDLFNTTTAKIHVNDINFKDKIAEFKPSIVIHLASYLTPSDDWDDITKLIETNIVFLSKILDAVSNIELKLFVNTGTFAEYFKGDDDLLPAYFYAATKTASRSIVDYYANSYNFKQTIIVPYTIYGGNNSQKKIIDIIYESTLNEKPLDLSRGEQVLDFIHIDDVVDFYILSIKNINFLPKKVIFKLGTGVGNNLKEIAKYVEKITKKQTNINWGAKDYRKSDVMYAVANIETLQKYFNWIPKISLEKGLKKYINKKSLTSKF
jgi:nucleoside-diphosphate-sugar epimerase